MTESTIKIGNTRVVFKNSTMLLKILILTLLVFSMLALAALSWVRVRVQTQTQDLESQIAQESGINRQLSDRLKDMNSDEAVQEIAEQELGLVKPNTVLITPNTTPFAMTIPRSRPRAKLMKQSAINPATVVIDEPTTEVSVFPIATAIASLWSPGFFSFSSL